jgi:hypothetical protein
MVRVRGAAELTISGEQIRAASLRGLAFALAEVLGATRLADARALAVSIFPLLRCRTRGEMLGYSGVRDWSLLNGRDWSPI